MLRGLPDELGDPIDIHQDGYLFLLSTPEQVATFRKHLELQNSLGVPTVFLSEKEIARMAPDLGLEGILGGTYCPWDGIAEPHGVTQGYAAGARRLGAEIRTGVRVTGLRCERGRIAGVETSEGTIPCGAVVNAAGPHAREVAGWAGVDLPVYPERRHVYTTHPFTGAPGNYLMVIDFETTFYFHRESGGVLMGMGNPEEQTGFNVEVDPDFLDRMLEVALRRYPAIEDAAINRAWAGLYEMTPDALPFLGRVDEIDGLYLINGFSGHGFQHAPIAGRLVAEEIVFGSARTLDIAPLRFDRIRSRLLSRELNVV
jgi:sarcosine oxidase subunit beta